MNSLYWRRSDGASRVASGTGQEASRRPVPGANSIAVQAPLRDHSSMIPVPCPRQSRLPRPGGSNRADASGLPRGSA